MVNKTKIEWCDSTINLVTGCPRGCEYCYAKRMNDRYKWVEDFSKPQAFPHRLKQLSVKKPHSVFMDSMSDVAYWEPEWMDMAVKAMVENPQHNYVFLTKDMVEAVHGLYGALLRLYFHNSDINMWLGETVVSGIHDPIYQPSFLSVEPMMGKVDISNPTNQITLEAVIVGAETGNRKDKVIPQKEWVLDLVEQCDGMNIPVFMKENIRSVVGDADFRTDRLPWTVR